MRWRSGSNAQPEWSDFPFILLTQRGGGIERNPAALRFLKTLGNVTFLERPFHPTSLVSLVQSALRGRRRQYEARARLEVLAQLNSTLEARVDAAVAERKILADIVESTDAFVQVLDLEFRFIAINRASAREFESVIGVQPQGRGLHAGTAVRPCRNTWRLPKSAWSRALAGEEFTEIVGLGVPKRGLRYYEMKFNSLFDHEGKRIGAYQFVHDVTKRHADQARLASAESALRQSQKMEAVGQLTGGVAHDFNNLLMAFSSGMFLLDQPMDADRRRRVLDSMKQAIDRGTALTRQLLAFSRRRPLAAKTVDLRERLLGMQEMLQRSLRGDMEVKMNFDDEPLAGGTSIPASSSSRSSISASTRAMRCRDGGTISISAQNGAESVTALDHGHRGGHDRGSRWRGHSSRSSRPRKSERDPGSALPRCTDFVAQSQWRGLDRKRARQGHHRVSVIPAL